MQSRQHVDADQTGKDSGGKADQQHGRGKSTGVGKKRRKVIVEEISEPGEAFSSKGKKESPEREGPSAPTTDRHGQPRRIDLSEIAQEKVGDDRGGQNRCLHFV